MHLLSFALVSSEPERSKQNLSAKAPYHMHKVHLQLTLDLLKIQRFIGNPLQNWELVMVLHQNCA